MTRYAHLLSPLTINGRTFRNRVFSSGHAPGYAENGMPGERYQRYHEEKARGGIGLTIFGGASSVSGDSGSLYGQIRVGTDDIVPLFRAFAQRIHNHGAGIMCQISHEGRRTSWNAGNWLPTKGPSSIRDPAHSSTPYALSTREIARIRRAFAAAARRCQDGELDGVEILATTHLLGQFISPLSNSRTDDYGGTIENRARFLLEVLEACREAVGDEFIIGVRFAPDERNEDGLPQEEGLEVAAMLGRHGVANYLNVNGAYGGTNIGVAETFPGMAYPSAPYVELARRVKVASGLPVLQASRIADPASAEWAVGQGYLDMAGMTRAHMADPHIVEKLQRGEEARIRPCVGAGYCLDRVYGIGRDAACAHNASTGRETVLPHRIAAAEQPRCAVVVGGGPAGLEAARVLALRGHRVTLFEAGARPGGQILLAAKGGWRKDVIGIADWLAQEADALGVTVRLNSYAQAEDVLAEEPDVVIVATGGTPDMALAEGGEEHVFSPWDVLSGARAVDGDVLVFDEVGAHAALSLAEVLTDSGCRIELVTIDRHVGRALGAQNYPVHLRNLYRAGVTFTSDHRLLGVRREGNRLIARVRNEFTRDVTEKEADAIVLDKGTQPATEVFDALVDGARNFGEIDHDALVACEPQPEDANPEGRYLMYRIGDALASRDIHAAILDANRLCRAL